MNSNSNNKLLIKFRSFPWEIHVVCLNISVSFFCLLSKPCTELVRCLRKGIILQLDELSKASLFQVGRNLCILLPWEKKAGGEEKGKMTGKRVWLMKLGDRIKAIMRQHRWRR